MTMTIDQDRHDKLTPKQIHKAIRVAFIAPLGVFPVLVSSPHSVCFRWDMESQSSNHKNWQCFDYIINILKEADVEFTVDSFQVNRCNIDVYCPETRLMFKLMFDEWI